MAEQIAGPIKKERGRELATLGERVRDEYYRTLQGRRLRVLVESIAAPATDNHTRRQPAPSRKGLNHEIASPTASPVSVIASGNS